MRLAPETSNSILWAYALTSIVLSFNLLALWISSGARRVRVGVAINPEHQSAKEDGAEQRKSCDLWIDPRREVSGCNSIGDQRDGRFARLGLEMVVKPSHGTVPRRSLDESWKTGREGRVADDISDVPKDALEFDEHTIS